MRTAIERLIETERRRRVGDLIARGYGVKPQTGDDPLSDVAKATAARTLRALDVEDSGAEWW